MKYLYAANLLQLGENMSELRMAINFIDNMMRARASGPFANEDTTVLTAKDADHVLNLLRTHEAKEDTLLFDLEMLEKERYKS